jgi:hypothetical protein
MAERARRFARQLSPLDAGRARLEEFARELEARGDALETTEAKPPK